MKTPRLSVALLSLLLVCLITLLYFLDHGAPYGFASSGIVRLERGSGSTPETNSFEKKETPEGYELTYGWKDFQERTLAITFPLSKQQLTEAVEEFGYNPEELRLYLEESLEKMNNEMISYLEKFTSQLILASEYSQYISMDKVSPIDFSLKLSVPAPISKEVRAEFDRIKKEIRREQEAYLRRITKEQEKNRINFLEDKGFKFMDERMGVNYRLVVLNNRPRVSQVVEAMRKEFGKKSLRQFLEVMLAFIQKIRYGIPPLREEDKIILEFWVPPKVLIENFGDCDSKGVTFASMWTNFKKYPLLLIKVPKHLFVGVAIPSIGGEGFTINGIRYTLCEVTGPDLIPPGLITQYSFLYLQGGEYRYELIK